MDTNLSRPPTPSEYALIALGLAGLLILFGLVGLGFRIFDAPQQIEVAAALTHYSGWSLALGVFIGVSYWLVRRFSE